MFSIIVPLYNKASYVKKAVDSILAQTFQEFELIVVDDGSTDDGPERIKLMKDDRLKIINQENSGISVARNNGVKASKYDYIAFLDADDWWDSRYLEEMSKFMAEYSDAAMWGASYYKVKGGRNIPAKIGVERGFEKDYINYCEVYAKTLWMPIRAGSVILKKNIFEEMNGFKPNLKLGEDFDLWIRIALKYKVAFLNKPLAYYNQDVELQNRAVGSHLFKKNEHCLFNMDYLLEKELQNKSLKKLLDALRVYALFPYYLDKERRNETKLELNKVDWTKQPIGVKVKYRFPVFIIECYFYLRKLGFLVKQFLKKGLWKKYF